MRGVVAGVVSGVIVCVSMTFPLHAQPSFPRDAAHPPAFATRIAVFGADQRSPLKADRQTLARSIGTLHTRAAAYCTAFCVADDLIATAGHCLFGTAASAAPDLIRTRFVLSDGADARVAFLHRDTIAKAPTALRAGTRRLSLAPPIGAADDWAIARLAKPICSDRGLALADRDSDATPATTTATTATAPREIYHVSFHADLAPARLTIDGPCRVDSASTAAPTARARDDFSTPDRVLLHDCDTGAGSSGSPLLVDGLNGPQVIAINVGTYVLSRMVVRDRTARPAEDRKAIANTAAVAAQFRDAVDDLVLMSKLSRPAANAAAHHVVETDGVLAAPPSPQ
ncbi:MAG: trypsin-like serine peptidase [Hyphomicrobium sp.]